MGAGKKLQTFLRDKNISVTALSRETGISSNTLYAIIKRDSNISTEIMSKIANSLNISMDELSKLLSDNKKEPSDTETISSNSHILDPEIDKNFSDTEELIKRLNVLTINYESAIRRLVDYKIRKEHVMRQRDTINEEIEKLNMEICILENDTKNRMTEIVLTRRKIEQKRELEFEYRKSDTPEE